MKIGLGDIGSRGFQMSLMLGRSPANLPELDTQGDQAYNGVLKALSNIMVFGVQKMYLQ